MRGPNESPARRKEGQDIFELVAGNRITCPFLLNYRNNNVFLILRTDL